MARDIRYQHSKMIITYFYEIVIVAAGLGRGLIVGKEIEAGSFRQLLADQTLLDLCDAVSLFINDGISFHQLVV